MTAQEAIDILKTGFDCNLPMLEPVYKLAIEALEKQIPKNVIFEEDGEVLLCPNCKFDLMGSITDPDHDPYYCFECGQALKWN